jgi:hypothetical protein
LPQYPLPSHALAQIADLLGVDQGALDALVSQPHGSHGDPSLVALTVAEAARRIPAEAVAEFVATRRTSADFDTAA